MKSEGKYTIFVIVFTVLLAFVNTISIFSHDSEIGLLSYIARSNELLQQDPIRSLSCFNKYIPLISQIANNYELNFKACLNESEAASANADEATLEQRTKLANAAENSCALLKQCQEDNSVEGIFQCYIHGGSASIQIMYIINANASQQLATLREQYYLIKNKEYKCTNETKRAYEIESAEAYAGLNNCILGISDIGTVEPSTPTASPTKTTEETSVKTETSANPLTTKIIPDTTLTIPVKITTQKPEVSTEKPSETTIDAHAGTPKETTISSESTEARTNEASEVTKDIRTTIRVENSTENNEATEDTRTSTAALVETTSENP